jgi:hypothetical protein
MPAHCGTLTLDPGKLFLTAVLLSALVLSPPASAQPVEQQSPADWYDLIVEYVNKIQNIYDGSWAYTYTQEDRLEQETSTRRIDPALDGAAQDALLAVNGEPPSAERLAEHRRMVEKRLKRRQRNAERRERTDNDGNRRSRVDGNEKERFLAMLIPESLSLVQQEGDLAYLRFRAVEEDRRHIFEHLYGILVLDTKREFIEELQVRLTEPFAPWFLTKVEEGYFSVRFALVDGHPMQQSITWKVRGQAVLVWDLDADMEVVWKDFSKVTPNLGSL